MLCAFKIAREEGESNKNAAQNTVVTRFVVVTAVLGIRVNPENLRCCLQPTRHGGAREGIGVHFGLAEPAGIVRVGVDQSGATLR